jgi:hypothetical protein
VPNLQVSLGCFGPGRPLPIPYLTTAASSTVGGRQRSVGTPPPPPLLRILNYQRFGSSTWRAADEGIRPSL